MNRSKLKSAVWAALCDSVKENHGSVSFTVEPVVDLIVALVTQDRLPPAPEWDSHDGYGDCTGSGKVWVDDGEQSNYYRGGSCSHCRPDTIKRDPAMAGLLKPAYHPTVTGRIPSQPVIQNLSGSLASKLSWALETNDWSVVRKELNAMRESSLKETS